MAWISTQNRAILYVFLSGVLWAVQPGFFLIVVREFPDSKQALAFLNILGTAVVAGLVTAIFADRARLRPVFQTPRRRRRLMRSILLDGAVVALSYHLLLHVAAQRNLAASAVFFEAWPIFSALILSVASRRTEDRQLGSVLAFLLFVLGYGFVNSENMAEMGVIAGSSGYALPLASGVLMGIGVAVIQMLLRAERAAFSGFPEFSLIICLRAVATAVFFAAINWAELRDMGTIAPPLVLVAAGFGVLVTVNSVLFHVGSAEARTNVVSLISLISPVLAPLLLALAGYAVLNTAFLVGAGFVVAGVALATRRADLSVQFVVLLTGILFFGSLVLFTDGRSSARYFDYIQAIAIFYGLIQSSAFARLVARYEAMAMMTIEAETAGAEAPRLDQKISFLRNESQSVSELLLLSMLGVSNIVIILGARVNTVLGDAVAYLMSSATLFLLVICWLYQLRIQTWQKGDAQQVIDLASPTRGRLFSYVVSVSIFAWFFFLILRPAL